MTQVTLTDAPVAECVLTPETLHRELEASLSIGCRGDVDSVTPLLVGSGYAAHLVVCRGGVVYLTSVGQHHPEPSMDALLSQSISLAELLSSAVGWMVTVRPLVARWDLHRHIYGSDSEAALMEWIKQYSGQNLLCQSRMVQLTRAITDDRTWSFWERTPG